ncbi:hypothetical protein [Nonomuraea sp. MG754425]|nr:hypothetical protein [Nonomuraea sp. MG754425]
MPHRISFPTDEALAFEARTDGYAQSEESLDAYSPNWKNLEL